MPRVVEPERGYYVAVLVAREVGHRPFFVLNGDDKVFILIVLAQFASRYVTVVRIERGFNAAEVAKFFGRQPVVKGGKRAFIYRAAREKTARFDKAVVSIVRGCGSFFKASFLLTPNVFI